MWALDITTLFLILFLVNVVLTLMLFTFWRSQKTYDGFRIWMLSLLVTSCGYFLYLLYGSAPAWISSTGANLLIALSVMMRLDSTGKYFRSRALPKIVYGVLVPAAFLLFWFMIVTDSVVVRGVIVGLLIVPCFVATSLIAIRSKEPETRSLRYSFSAALLVLALLWTTIVINGVTTPGDHSLQGPDLINPVFFIVTILMDIVLTASFLMLNMARSQIELRKSEDALSRTNKKLTILSSITRHDIKNQLTALVLYLELSKDELSTNPGASEYLKKEMAIAEIIGLQIDFSKAYEDMGTTAPVWQNVNESIRRAVAALPMQAVRVEVDRSDLALYADPLFEKVFYNLIDNALRHGGNTLTRIHITCHETDNGLVLICEDDGAGITGEDKDHLFMQGCGKHTGLGLFLSREILSITGITIAETSEPGKGARFEMNVPKGAYRFGTP